MENNVKRLIVVSTKLGELSARCEPPTSDELKIFQNEICDISKNIQKLETPIYKTPTMLLRSTKNQFILPLPAKVRDLLGLTKDCRDVIVTVHGGNDDDKWIVIK